MAINLQDLITVLGGQGMFLGAAYFLFKAGIAHKFALEAKEFETQLKAKADVEIEQLKSSLQMIAYEQQVRFSKLHDRRAEVIAELYKRLVVDVFWVGQQFLSKGTFSNVVEERQAEFIETGNKFRDFSLFVDTNRIYLPEEICTLLDKFVDDVRKTVVGVAVWGTVPFPNQETQRKWLESLGKAYQAFETEIPAARKALETEFRAVLGDSTNNRPINPAKELPPSRA